MRAGTLDTVSPVWKYSDHHQRKASVAAIANRIWKKINPIKSVLDIERLPTTDMFMNVWSEFSSDPYAPNTPVKTIFEFISALDKKK